MANLTIETHENRSAYRPGESIEGIAGWELDRPAKWVEVRLFYQTAGKGDEDAAIVEVQRFDDPATTDAQVFRFAVPDGPFSYAGRLIELRWGIEVVAHRVKQPASMPIVLSASGEALSA